MLFKAILDGKDQVYLGGFRTIMTFVLRKPTRNNGISRIYIELQSSEDMLSNEIKWYYT